MVQLMMNSSQGMPATDSQRRQMVAVKLEVEVEDPLEDAHGPLGKRSKLSQDQSNLGIGAFPIPPSQFNPLDEPSPLGLTLRKSPSLLDLIQMRLSQGNASNVGAPAKKEHKSTSSCGLTDKLKASNFPASFLRIGTWEYKSRYEGDLVAKCYFAKHKLVWEVLDGGLKNKIEIQWSDIMALKANYPDDAPGTLDVVLARQPLFFRETNPQPRKHTLWQATSDFTGGQASISRRHFLQCPQGLLGKHFEKLIQCDPRLNFLSQQGEIVLESPYFEPRVSVFDDPNEINGGFDANNKESTVFDLRDTTAQSSMKNEKQDFSTITQEHFPRETPSPSSVMDDRAIEEIRIKAGELRRLGNQDQIKVPGLHPSMSMSDFVSQIEHRFAEKTSRILSNEDRESLEILDEITRCLFSDSQLAPTSDEKSIMSRVNSLCCLLQKDPSTVQNFQLNNDDDLDEAKNGRKDQSSGYKTEDFPASDDDSDDFSERKPAPTMTRKDSVGELLLNLPRIASLPQFLFNISEDFDNQAR